MDIAIFVTTWSDSLRSGDLRDRFSEAPLGFLKNERAVRAVEFYTPEPGDVPRLDDAPAPDLMIQIDVDDAAAAKVLVESDTFKQLFLDRRADEAAGEKINLEILESVHYPLPGQPAPAPRTAPLSFVVRYYGPVKDLSQFVDFYTHHHPPIVGKFEGIRNVLCYLPLDWEKTGAVLDASMIIGNEVVFDDLAALQRALKSEVLEEAMADSQHFQAFGYSTHHAMHRERVYTRENS